MALRLALLPALLLLAACSGKDDEGDSAVDDTGADSGGETGDTGPEPVVYTSLAAQSNYFMSSAGQVICDNDLSLTSRPYTGSCDDCAFAFYIDAEVTAERGTPDCAMFPMLSFVPGDWNGVEFTDLFMVLHSAYDAGGGYVFYNWLTAGYSAVYGGYDYPGPYYYPIGYGGGFLGRTTFRDDVLTLDWYYYAPPYNAYNYVYFDDCGEKLEPSTEVSAADGVSASSRLTCDGLTGDVWEFTVAEGASLEVSVDTLGADTTFDPMLIINGPDGCTEVIAQDNFLCTYPPPTYLCPSWSEPRAAGGTWTAVVLNMGSCAGSEAEYAITVGGTDDVRLVTDDFDAWTALSESFKLTVLMNAQLTAE